MVSDFKKKKKSSTLTILLGGIIILSLLVVLVIANVRVYRKKSELMSKIEKLENKAKEMEIRNSALKQAIEKTDEPEYIEKIAREDLDLQQPGEKVVSFVISKELKEQDEEPSNPWLGWLNIGWQWIKKALQK